MTLIIIIAIFLLSSSSLLLDSSNSQVSYKIKNEKKTGNNEQHPTKDADELLEDGYNKQHTYHHNFD